MAKSDDAHRTWSQQRARVSRAGSEIIAKQNAAREAYLQVETAMTEIKTAEQLLKEADAAVIEASEAVKRFADKPKGGKS